jgi:hypothetical protein
MQAPELSWQAVETTVSRRRERGFEGGAGLGCRRRQQRKKERDGEASVAQFNQTQYFGVRVLW